MSFLQKQNTKVYTNFVCISTDKPKATPRPKTSKRKRKIWKKTPKAISTNGEKKKPDKFSNIIKETLSEFTDAAGETFPKTYILGSLLLNSFLTSCIYY